MAGNCTEREGGKNYIFKVGSRPRARQIMESIAQDAMLETEMEEGKLSVVVCAGWNTLSQTVICYQELQCLKALSKCAAVAEFLQVSVAFSGLPLLSFSELWPLEKPPKPCSGCLGGAWSTCVVDVGRWSCCENHGGYENFLNSPI